ncbi:MAG: elongation factor P maturation arginine rhamnosyltransferase EarP [Comamonadaceae bacterium]|nr:MAG: elongation factor P maturation arginine rhamnosyltransferase EarP [Comamonadaceae bacterium]
MRWDLFCKVIDNHGDLGVCWRLACQLAAAGDAVRLWVDDADALGWMAPSGHDGVSVIDWRDAEALRVAVAAPPPDVLIEAFGCDPAPELIAHFASAADAAVAGRQKHAWINLEYLSAEPYVERLHRLPSPVFRGPGEGLTKYFFYPGFTAATGGLMREAGLPTRQAAFDRQAWLSAQGIDWQGERLVTLFCYEPAGLAELLAQLDAGLEPTRLLVTAGRASAATRAALSSQIGLQRPPDGRSVLSISYLPHLAQTDFDHLLWASDLNFVRGEDSLVRALWAGAPFVWQIYPQEDDAHHVKLEAFLDWLGAPPSLRQFHRSWNGFGSSALPALDAATLAEWRATTQAARQRLLAQDDLATQLRRFVGQQS